MKLSSLAAAAILSLTAVAASADTLVAYEVNKASATFTNPGYFMQRYDYYLDPVTFPDQQADVGWAFTELKFKDVKDIDFASVLTNLGHAAVNFYSHTGALLWSGTPTPGAGPADGLSVDTFYTPTSHFYLTIEGYAVGKGPGVLGSYSMEITAAPVPEPESLAMALGGLGLGGVALFKRRRVTDNASV